MTILPRTMKTVVSASVAVILLLTLVGVGSAAVIGGGVIILAPASVVNSDLAGGAGSFAQRARRQEDALMLFDAGVIPAGTVANSHMIFLDETDLALENVRGWYCLVGAHLTSG